jgi:hypothetical protein
MTGFIFFFRLFFSTFTHVLRLAISVLYMLLRCLLLQPLPTRTPFWNGATCSPDLLDHKGGEMVPRVIHGTKLKLGGRRGKREDGGIITAIFIHRDNFNSMEAVLEVEFVTRSIICRRI